MFREFKQIAAVMIGCIGINGLAASDEPHDQMPTFMRAKLASSKKVLEGLVTEDFKIIREAALDMKRMSGASQWPKSDDGSYQHHQRAFERDCEELARLCDEKNLTGAHYTYLRLTTDCINCHDYVRRSFQVSRDADNPQGPVILIPNEWEGSRGRRKHSTSETAYSHDAR